MDYEKAWHALKKRIAQKLRDIGYINTATSPDDHESICLNGMQTGLNECIKNMEFIESASKLNLLDFMEGGTTSKENLDMKSALQYILKHKNKSQLDLANTMGCSRQWINKIIGRGSYKLSDISNIAEMLGYDMLIQFVDREDGSVVTSKVKSEKSTSGDA